MTYGAIVGRRRALAMSLAAAVFWPAGRAVPLSPSSSVGDLARRLLVSVLGDADQAWTIGDAYLRKVPEERSTKLLLRAIVQPPSTTPHFPADFGRLTRVVRQRVRQDFVDGAIVNVDGWILSVTEARLYGLAALAHEEVAAWSPT